MAIQIRLDFPTFCSFYSNNEMSVHKERGKKNELAFKHTIHGQLTRQRPIRAFPLKIDFEFWTSKEYNIPNFYLPAQWILETFRARDILQDINPLVVAETTIRTKQVNSHAREGVVITIERYHANKTTPAK